jgi:hypothetical protein
MCTAVHCDTGSQLPSDAGCSVSIAVRGGDTAALDVMARRVHGTALRGGDDAGMVL